MDAKLALCQAAMMLALAGACGAAETTAPLSAAARYDVFRNGWRVAVVSETFEAKDGAYRIVSESRAVGLLALVEKHTLRFVSSGVLTPSGLRPQHFEGKRSDADSRQVRADFDWQTGQLTIVRLPTAPRSKRRWRRKSTATTPISLCLRASCAY